MKRLVPALGLLALHACGGTELRESAYADGTPWSRIELDGGLPHGVWRTWHPNEKLASEELFCPSAPVKRPPAGIPVQMKGP